MPLASEYNNFIPHLIKRHRWREVRWAGSSRSISIGNHLNRFRQHTRLNCLVGRERLRQASCQISKCTSSIVSWLLFPYYFFLLCLAKIILAAQIANVLRVVALKACKFVVTDFHTVPTISVYRQEAPMVLVHTSQSAIPVDSQDGEILGVCGSCSIVLSTHFFSSKPCIFYQSSTRNSS